MALAYTEDTEWRNRAEFVKGQEAVRQVCGRAAECYAACGVHAAAQVPPLPPLRLLPAGFELSLLAPISIAAATSHVVCPAAPCPADQQAALGGCKLSPPRHRPPQFLRRKWEREQGYVLRKYLWAFQVGVVLLLFGKPQLLLRPLQPLFGKLRKYVVAYQVGVVLLLFGKRQTVQVPVGLPGVSIPAWLCAARVLFVPGKRGTGVACMCAAHPLLLLQRARHEPHASCVAAAEQ